MVKHERDLFPAMPSFFEELLDKDWLTWPFGSERTSGSVPAVNVKETDKAYALEVAAPGMTKQDFKVQLDNNRLIISAEKENKEEESDENRGYTRREFRYQSFVRTFNLPESVVNNEQIAANYKDGILHITIPKSEEARLKNVRQIQIS